MAHRWLVSTSLPTHACQKLLGLNAHVSILYYQVINIQEMALNKYVSNYVMCLQTVGLVPECLGEKQNLSKALVWVIFQGLGQRLLASLPVCSLPDSVWNYLSSLPWQCGIIGSDLRILELHPGSPTSWLAREVSVCSSVKGL